MFKRGISYFIFIVLFVSCVYASHTATISISPNSSYEGADSYFDLEIWNRAGSDTITNVTLDLSDYTIINVSSSVPSSINSNTSITWYKDIPASWIAHVFFWARADFVDADTLYNWNITTYDNNLGINLSFINITALNDTVGPEVLTFPNEPILRGENFTISAVVSDLYNNIDRVYADVNIPNGTVDSFNLILDNGTYYGTYETNNGYLEGIYNINVYGVDSAGNINSNSTIINVESYYNISISLSNSNPSNGETVNVNGNIKYDNESISDNVNISIFYLENLSYVLSDINGDFILSFTANSEGYVYANTTNYNNRSFGSNVVFMTIYVPPSNSGSSGGSSHSSRNKIIEEPEENKTPITIITPLEKPVEKELAETDSSNKVTGFAIVNIIKSKPILALIILIVVILSCFSAYWFIFKKKKETYGF